MESPQIISLKKIGVNDAEKTGEVLSRDRVGDLGGTEQKWRDVVKLDGRPVEFIERHPTPDSVPETGKPDPVEFTAERINILNESGIPTPVFYKSTIKGDVVLLSENVKPIGGGIYGKSAVERISRGEKISADYAFVELLDKRSREVFGMEEIDPPDQSLWKWMIEANSKGVILPSDDAMELVISPDGSFKWMVIDPAGVATSAEININPMEVASRNLNSVKKVFQDVYATIYKSLKK